MKKVIVCLLIIAGMFLMMTGSAVISFGNLKITGDITSETADAEIKEMEDCIPLSDTYDGKGGSLNSFMERKDLLGTLIDVNRELNENDSFEYLQINHPSVYYPGDYKGPDATIEGGEEYRNASSENGETLTALNTIEVSDQASLYIAEEMEQGRWFEKDDFSRRYDKVIPVVLGHSYSGAYSPGDEITLRYYMADIKVRIAGIMKDGAVLYLPSIAMELDDCMVFPEVGIVPGMPGMDFHNKVMMLEKNEGYIGVVKNEDYPEVISEIKRISEKYNIAYNIEMIEEIYDNILKEEELNRMMSSDTAAGNESSGSGIANNLDEKYEVLMKIAEISGFLFLASGLAVWCRRKVRMRHPDRRSVTDKTFGVLELTALMTAGYVTAYIMMKAVMIHFYGDAFSFKAVYYTQGIIRLILIAMYIVSCVYVCRRKEVNERQETL